MTSKPCELNHNAFRHLVFRGVGIVVLILLLCCGGARADDWRGDLESILEKSRVQGASVVLLEGGGKSGVSWQWQRDGRETIDSGTMFRAGSVSKLVTSLLVLRAAEAGLLRLDDPVEKYLPGIFEGNPGWVEAVTIANLLEHTAGLPGSTYAEYAADEPGLAPSEYVREHAPFKLRWKPGLHYSYANSGHTIASAVLEITTGMSFDDYASQELFQPLGMKSSSFSNTLGKVRGLSATFDAGGQEIENLWQMPVRPSGSLVTRPDDLEKLMRMLLSNGKLPGGEVFLKPGSIRRMHHGQTSAAAKNGAHAGSYGLGNFGFVSSGFVFQGHWGRTDGFQTNLGYLPGHNRGFVLMLNTADRTAAHQLRKTITDHLVKDLPKPPEPETTDDITPLNGGYFLGYSHDMPMRSWLFGLLGAKQMEATETGFRMRGIMPGSGWREYREVGENLYAAEGIPVATATLVESDGERFLIDGESLIESPAWRIYGELGILLSGVVTAILTIVIIPVVLIFRIRKKQPLLVHACHLGASLALLLLIWLFYTYGLAGMGRELGRVSVVSLSLFVCSLCVPLGAAMAMCHPSSTKCTRLAVFPLFLTLFVLALHGWCPLVTWMP